MPTDSQIQEQLQDYVEVEHSSPGIVVGLIDEQGSRVLACGKRKTGGAETVDGDTIFEIGSVTKVFTTLLLQELADCGEVNLEDPIKKFLPTSVQTPSRNGREITLLDLATHSSGLPRLPDNVSTVRLLLQLNNPYADYSAEQLYDFLAHYKLPRDVGAQYEYSNLGVGLLGQLLSLRAGTNYEALVVNRICQPLKMSSSQITPPELKARLASGHNASGKPVSNWDFQALAGCGAIRSSVNDMLKFLSANMALSPSPLAATIARTHVPRRDAGLGQKIALGWHINSDSVVWHNGGTGGYHSFIGFNPQTRRGVVVLANSANSVDALALPQLGPARGHALATIDPGIYDLYVGDYRFSPAATLTITRDGVRFFARLNGQHKLEFFPESETDLFCKVVDAQLTCVKSQTGGVTHVILHQNGFDQKAVRIKQGRIEF